MKKTKRFVALGLVAVMVLSLLSVAFLSGCKDKDKDQSTGGGDYTTDLSGHTHDEDDEPMGIDEDVRVLPAGVTTLPLDESMIRGAVATGSFDFTLDNEDGAVFIPIGTVPAGTVITIPVTFEDVTFSVMLYDQDGGADSYEYFAAFDVSPCHGWTNGIGFHQVEYQGYTSYLACDVCGEILRQDVMGMENDSTGRQFCRPWTIDHEKCYTYTLDEQSLDMLGMCGWISDEETGEYSPGVPYITRAQAIGTKAVMIPYEVIREGFEQFYLWQELDRAMAGENVFGEAGALVTTDDAVVDEPAITPDGSVE